MRPKCYKRETESLHCNLGGTDRSSRSDRNVTKENREITISVRPKSLSVRPICLGFVAVAMTFETRWRRIERIGGAEFDFWFRSNVDVGR